MNVSLFCVHSFDYTSLPIHVCETDCDGDEDELIDCSLDTSCTFSGCTHDDDIGVTCGKYSLKQIIMLFNM